MAMTEIEEELEKAEVELGNVEFCAVMTGVCGMGSLLFWFAHKLLKDEGGVMVALAVIWGGAAILFLYCACAIAVRHLLRKRNGTKKGAPPEQHPFL